MDNFASGYTCALLHLQRNFAKMVDQGIKLNNKTVRTYLQQAINNREELRTTGWIEGLKYNSKRGFFRDEEYTEVPRRDVGGKEEVGETIDYLIGEVKK